MRKIIDGKNVTLIADGYNDLSTVARENGKNEDGSLKPFDRSYHNDSRTLDQALTSLVSGWPKIVDKIDNVREQVRQRIGALDVSTFRFDNAVIGQYLDVSSFLAGEPTCMLQAFEDTTKRADKFVRILVDVSFSWNVKPEDIATRGGAIIALADALNHCGYSTEVWACVGVASDYGAGDVCTVLLPVQAHGSPWDIHSASFPLANGDYLRRAVFAVQESLTDRERSKWGFGVGGNGYGYPHASKQGGPSDVHCGGADVIIQSNVGAIDAIVRDPVAWVLGQCKNLGVITDQELVGI